MTTALTTKKLDNALDRAATFVAAGGVGLNLQGTITTSQAKDIELFLTVYDSLNKWAWLDWAYWRREDIYAKVAKANDGAQPAQLRSMKAKVWQPERDRLAILMGKSPAYLDQMLSVVAKWPLEHRVHAPATFDMHRLMPTKLPDGSEWSAEDRHDWLVAFVEEAGGSENIGARFKASLAEHLGTYLPNEGETLDEDGEPIETEGAAKPKPKEQEAPTFADIIGLTEEVLGMVVEADEYHALIQIDDRQLVVTLAEFDGTYVLRYDVEGGAQ